MKTAHLLSTVIGNLLKPSLFLSTLLWLLPLKAEEPFKPVGNFVFTMPNGINVQPSADNLDVIAGVTAAQALQGFARQQLSLALGQMAEMNKDLFIPINASLRKVQRAQMVSNSQAAKAAAEEALAKINAAHAKDKAQVIHVVVSAAPKAIGSQNVADLDVKFSKYVDNLQNAVNQAQGVSSQIDTYLKNNTAGINLLQEAQAHQGEAYASGIKCSDLIKKAGRAAGSIPSNPSVDLSDIPGLAGVTLGLSTVTSDWFVDGMGPEYKQIYGDKDGMTLGELTDKETAGKINIPIGSVLVTPGHAALFDGIVEVTGKMQLLLYDSNDSTGWTISVNGAATKDDPKNT